MVKNRFNTINRIHQMGLSLVELMVAITVGLILTAGLIQLFVANKQAYRLQEGVLGMQENARFSLQTLSYDLRMAGHWGGIKDIKGTRVGVNLLACKQSGSALPSNMVYAVRGFDGGNNDANCVTGRKPEGKLVAANPASDVLVLSYAEAERLSASDLKSASNAASYFISSISGFSGLLNTGTKLAAEQDASSTGGRFVEAGTVMEGVYNYPFKQVAYYVRSCSVLANCGTDKTPTLTRLVWDNNKVTSEPIAEGVESMQVEYGIGANGSVTQYKNATQVWTAGEWDKVSAVRISLVTRASDADLSYDDPHTSAANPYNLFGDVASAADDYLVPAKDHRRRKVVIQVAQLRNSGRS